MRGRRARGQLWAFIYLAIRSLIEFGILSSCSGRSNEIELNLAVGPYGVLVIESKYSSSKIDLTSPGLTDDVQTAQAGARQCWTDSRLTGSRHAMGPGSPCSCLLGTGAASLPVRRIDEVRLVSGADSKRWTPLLWATKVVSKECQQAVCTKIESYMSTFEAVARTD
jgi:hypothetical protein